MPFGGTGPSSKYRGKSFNVAFAPILSPGILGSTLALT